RARPADPCQDRPRRPLGARGRLSAAAPREPRRPSVALMPQDPPSGPPGSGGPVPEPPVQSVPWLRPRWRGTLARNTAWMAVGQGSRVALGASYFVVIARALHPDGLGAFAGAVALVGLAAPFASLGAGNLMIKHVARDPRHFSRY